MFERNELKTFFSLLSLENICLLLNFLDVFVTQTKVVFSKKLKLEKCFIKTFLFIINFLKCSTGYTKMHFGIGLHYILVKKMFCNTQFIRLFIQNGIYSLSFSSKEMKLRFSQQKLLRVLRLESSQKTKILFLLLINYQKILNK